MAANPDRKREYDRRRRERRKADPEAYAIHLDQSRESKRRTQGISSTRYRTSRRLREADPGEDGYVSALPFAEWIRERAAEAGGWKA
ncbi:MAG: hypothetical protein ACREXY_01330, partial [Gammaproteobacteria bacterium]